MADTLSITPETGITSMIKKPPFFQLETVFLYIYNILFFAYAFNKGLIRQPEHRIPTVKDPGITLGLLFLEFRI